MILNGSDVTEEIRTPEMSRVASLISAQPAVRAFLLDLQRDMAKRYSVMMDGRDIGTVVLPGADVKVYLTASPEVRARRRLGDLEAQGLTVSYEQVLEEIRQRDHQGYDQVHRPHSSRRRMRWCWIRSSLNQEESLAALKAIVRSGLPDEYTTWTIRRLLLWRGPGGEHGGGSRKGWGHGGDPGAHHS